MTLPNVPPDAAGDQLGRTVDLGTAIAAITSPAWVGALTANMQLVFVFLGILLALLRLYDWVQKKVSHWIRRDRRASDRKP